MQKIQLWRHNTQQITELRHENTFSPVIPTFISVFVKLEKIIAHGQIRYKGT